MTKRKRYRRQAACTNKNTLLRYMIVAFVLLVGVKFASDIRARDEERALRERESETAFALPGKDSLLHVVTNPVLDQLMLNRTGMSISFNRQMHEPNWVAWELTADETKGSIKRESKFSTDPDVEASADPWDYNYTGFDRGHMAPAGDMKWDADAMRETFYMTNICPQAKALNTGAWKNLEERCRRWAQRDSSLIIVCGPVLTDTITEFIGDNRVAVPSRFFKVILAPYAKPMRAIGFIFPNAKAIGGLQPAAVSVDSVESVTGHDFFTALPDSLQKIIEAQSDFHLWNTLK